MAQLTWFNNWKMTTGCHLGPGIQTSDNSPRGLIKFLCEEINLSAPSYKVGFEYLDAKDCITSQRNIKFNPLYYVYMKDNHIYLMYNNV